jgi:hypothetical protein
MRTRLAIPLIGLVLAGCGSKDNVALSGSISDVAISIEQLTLGMRLTGGFNLRLELGAQAPQTANVSLGSFSLLGPDQNEVAPLMVLDPGQVFPLPLEPGQSRSAELTLDDGDPIAAERSLICQSLRVAGVVTDDAANGRVTSVSSAAFLPGGC